MVGDRFGKVINAITNAAAVAAILVIRAFLLSLRRAYQIRHNHIVHQAGIVRVKEQGLQINAFLPVKLLQHRGNFVPICVPGICPCMYTS